MSCTNVKYMYKKPRHLFIQKLYFYDNHDTRSAQIPKKQDGRNRLYILYIYTYTYIYLYIYTYTHINTHIYIYRMERLLQICM